MPDGTLSFDTELDTSGVEAGLSELEKKTVSSAENVDKALTESAKAVVKALQDTDSVAGNTAADVQNKYLTALENCLNNSALLVNDAMKSLKLAYEVGAIDTEEYFSSLEKYRDRYFSRGSVEWQEYTAEIIKHNRTLLSEQNKALEDAYASVTKDIKKQFDELEKDREKLEKKLFDYGGISRTVTIKGDEDITFTALGDIKAQNADLQEYCDLLLQAKARVENYWRTDTDDAEQNAKNRNLRDNYFSQIRGLSVAEGIDFAKILTGTGEQKFTDYLDEYAKKTDLSKSISNMLMTTEVSDTCATAGENLGKSFTNALSEELESLSGKFFSTGEEACKSFSQGFASKIAETLSQLSAQIYIDANKTLAGSVENNTSYNIYSDNSPSETIRKLKQQEELKELILY